MTEWLAHGRGSAIFWWGIAWVAAVVVIVVWNYGAHHNKEDDE